MHIHKIVLSLQHSVQYVKVLNALRMTKEDKAKNTNTEISLPKRYKLFVVSKFSIYREIK